jgi:hypothetical protein
MKLFRQCTWKNPYTIEAVPPIARLYRAAYSPSSRRRYDLLRYPLRVCFAMVYQLGLRGRGALRLRVAGTDRVLGFDGRNLQFSSLYMPQHAQG